MRRKGYRALIILLVLLIVLVLSAMAYIISLLQNPPQTLPPVPAATAPPRLLTSRDFEPDRSVLFSHPAGTLSDEGRSVFLSSLRGRATVLVFWSSWCEDCKEFLQNDFVQAAQSARSSGATVQLVCREGVKDDSREAAEAALSRLNLTETTLMDPDAALYTAMGLHWVPAIAILDDEGRLMYTGREMPDAAELSALLRYAEDPAAQTACFLQTQLSNPAGAVVSGYQIKGGELVPGNTVLSESQGLLMLYAAQTGDQEAFDRAWRAVRDSLSVNGLTAWQLKDGKMADVNASLDDLRVIEALALADARWGMYSHAAASRAQALYDRCVRDGLMRDYASLKKNKTAQGVTLCYMDVAAMEAAATYNPRWQAAAKAARNLLAAPESLISEALPLYHARYDAKKGKYTGNTVQMNEACIAVLNAVRAGVAFPQTLDWLEATLAAGPVYARYGKDGHPLKGYEFESNATYSLLVQIGVAAGREQMVQMALESMERKRCFHGVTAGGYGGESSAEHYTFDELEAMLAWAAVDGLPQ